MQMMSIASGSSGNCIYIGSEETHILIDAGIAAVSYTHLNACSSGEWSDCGINSSSENVAALIADGEIVSAASYELWGEHIAHIGIITHPLFRGRGYAGKVLSYLTNFIFDQGLIPQYRTLCLNKPAISVARQCGYGQYAAHISVRLKR